MITMNNNFFLTNDSQSLYNQYMQMHVDHYSNLEKELQSLSDSDVNELSNFQPYIEANNKLSVLVQAELLSLVKAKINANPEVIQNVIGSIKEFKKIRQQEQDDFQDYIRNYSDLTYKEYKELKYEKK